MGQRKNATCMKDSSLDFEISVNKFTSFMHVYGELGAIPLDIDVISRMLTYLA